MWSGDTAEQIEASILFSAKPCQLCLEDVQSKLKLFSVLLEDCGCS